MGPDRDGEVVLEAISIKEMIVRGTFYYIYVCVCVCVCKFLSYVQLFATLWIVAWQAPLSMVFSRQEH